MASKIVLAYITSPDKETAEALGKKLLKKKLAGCINIFPITSMYWWKGRIAKGKEVVLIAKTTEERWKKLVKFVEKMHPYDCPCIIKLAADANMQFTQWLKGEVKS